MQLLNRRFEELRLNAFSKVSEKSMLGDKIPVLAVSLTLLLYVQQSWPDTPQVAPSRPS